MLSNVYLCGKCYNKKFGKVPEGQVVTTINSVKTDENDIRTLY